MVRADKNSQRMFVAKRDGRHEPVHFDKITSRIQKLCYGLDMEFIDPTAITLKVINGLYSGVTTVEVTNLFIFQDVALVTKMKRVKINVLLLRFSLITWLPRPRPR